MKFIRKEQIDNVNLQNWLTTCGYSNDVIRFIKNPPKQHSPYLLKDVELMCDELLSNDNITIIGDYDCDGCTSCSILYLTLKRCGKTVNYYIPHRIHDGYGMSKQVVDKALSLYPNTNAFLTCDNGIAAQDAVLYAKSLGKKVYITDHHTPDMNNLPEADVIVHPALGNYPFAQISGACVTYKLALVLLEKANIDDNELIEYIKQLAAISVVSDVMPLTSKDIKEMEVNENRDILIEGLDLLRNKPNWRFKDCLFPLIKVDENLDETSIGFYISPLINAVGRLGDAKFAVDFFTSDNVDEVGIMAGFMFYNNEKRKKLKKVALDEINQTTDFSKPGIVCKTNIHEGIIGIIAGQLSEQHKKPSVVFTEAMHNGVRILKGSARSPKGCNLYEILTKINDEHPGIILTYGGHEGAAGLSIDYNKFNDFSPIFFSLIPPNLDTPDFSPLFIPASELIDFGNALKDLKPFGHGLPKPIIATKLYLNKVDLFYSSRHVKLSNAFGDTELWMYNALDDVINDTSMLQGFKFVKNNVEKRLETMNQTEAENGRWECYSANKEDYPVFNCILEVDYGPCMGKVGVNYGVKEVKRCQKEQKEKVD